MNWLDPNALPIVLLCGAVAAALGSPVVRWFLNRVESADPDGLELPGGRWIGVLERTAAFAAVCAGSEYALTMIVAVKGLGRYPELRTAKSGAVSERFIIGTFASLLWACAWGGIARLLLLLST
ncbi:hypothetical protein SAMN05445756_0489 [Kytococcus aerolatus]|uniref:Uncharacterized protein n=1 Tax=Kytococcus aerolatus TaxID=592308 RepID=A0A212T5Z0_9MICO|nr:hypothetical protein [Kytococcus aerolatus]SNC61473.1 hypothetical protein SAMN05445756_0489 [Kytococcus aerolatus]